MSIEVGLGTLLSAHASITGAVSGLTVSVFASTADQSAELPYIVYRFTDTDVQNTLSSASDQHRSDVMVECYAARFSHAVTIRDAVYEFLKDYSGAAGDQTIHGVLASKGGTDFDPPYDNSDVGRHIAEVSFDIAHQET